MDLDQRKLNKSEWESIEVPVSDDEKLVLRLIMNGFHNVNIKFNKHLSIFSFLKVEFSDKMEDYLFNEFLLEPISTFSKTYKLPDNLKVKVSSKVQIRSADRIRLQNTSTENLKEKDIYDFVLLNYLENLVKFAFLFQNKRSGETAQKVEENRVNFLFNYFTLEKLIKNSVEKINKHLLTFIQSVLKFYEDKIDFFSIIANSAEFLERNYPLLKYSDLELYEHQKKIFTAIKENNEAKLILYIAPTGTGKTLTPLALSENYRVIFVCAARHVGLALAKAAISMEKKIAFAFGCGSATDIRLHYYAAADYTKDRRSGGIGKVDNSNGIKVEIIICDIKSYLPAMFYMKSFNNEKKIITYWDEPTITMDYAEHAFHATICKNWSENIIPNVVLSSATLPKLHELSGVISDFREKFSKSEIIEIVSHDCKKSIPLINKDGFVVLPHFLSNNYLDVLKIVNHCNGYQTLLRYFDMKEISEFITYVLRNDFMKSKVKLERYFETLDDLTMKKIKEYYLIVLENILPDKWETINAHLKKNRKCRLPLNESVDSKGNKIQKSVSIGPGVKMTSSTYQAGSEITRISSVAIPNLPSPPSSQTKLSLNGLHVTTKDAYTLTDGPTIFISDDVEKIAKFCIQQANIPPLVMKELMEKIEYNNVLNQKIAEIECELEVIIEKSQKSVSGSKNVKEKDLRKLNRETEDEKGAKSDIFKLSEEIQNLKSNIKTANLNDTFIPNKPHHLAKWAECFNVTNAFTSSVDDKTVNEIMTLANIDDLWKILLLMGIGVFTSHKNIRYTEIMKMLADSQHLYLIIATSDYIYGTNYNFCHGYLSKELKLTQEKIIQALGRIGRNKIQQDYTLRFRDDSHFMQLFTEELDKAEVKNMNRLFNTKNIEFGNLVLNEEY